MSEREAGERAADRALLRGVRAARRGDDGRVLRAERAFRRSGVRSRRRRDRRDVDDAVRAGQGSADRMARRTPPIASGAARTGRRGTHFRRTGRPVHNVIDAGFEFGDAGSSCVTGHVRPVALEPDGARREGRGVRLDALGEKAIRRRRAAASTAGSRGSGHAGFPWRGRPGNLRVFLGDSATPDVDGPLPARAAVRARPHAEDRRAARQPRHARRADIGCRAPLSRRVPVRPPRRRDPGRDLEAAALRADPAIAAAQSAANTRRSGPGTARRCSSTRCISARCCAARSVSG